MRKIKETSFSEKTKNQICSLDFNEHCFFSLLNVILNNNAELQIQKNLSWSFKTKYARVISFLKTNLKKYFPKLKTNIFISDKKTIDDNRHQYKLEIIPQDFEDFETKIQNLNIKNQCCKRAYIAGLFLGCGSITDPLFKNYHLEFRIENEMVLKRTKTIFDFFNIKYSLTTRRQKYMMYFKKAEIIGDILKIINASDSLYEWEDLRINRDFNNSLRRLNNLEVSNLQKTIITNKAMIGIIKDLKKHDLYNELNKKEQQYCQAILNHPDYTFDQITNLINKTSVKKISRSGINHIKRKIKKLYKDLNIN